MTDTRSSDPAAVTSAVQFLMALHFINWLGFAGWNALLHNYTIEAVGFGWFEAGLTQTVREIPGFLAFTVAFWLMIVREQVLGYVALVMLGFGVALTGTNPTLMGVLMATFVMSVGFHYFETVNTSMQLQLLPKAQAPSLIGRIISAGAAAQFVAYGSIALVWWLGWRNYSCALRDPRARLRRTHRRRDDALQALPGTGAPTRRARRAQALRPLLCADLHERGATPALHGVRRLPAGQEVRLLRRRHGRADAGDVVVEHVLCPAPRPRSCRSGANATRSCSRTRC